MNWVKQQKHMRKENFVGDGVKKKGWKLINSHI